ncbi:MAG TPA: protein translocase subunit SecD [Elusimicrobiota bacterium]|nr:protein translocase subunit SecD [Elusimicrobiota bacterium]
MNNKKLQMKWGAVGLVSVLAVFLLYPTINWYSTPKAERAQMDAYHMRPHWLLNLGLDLKGGTSLLMELDVSKLPPGADLKDAVQRAIEIIRNRVDQFGVTEPLIARQGDRWIVVELPGITDTAQAKNLIGKTALLQFQIVDASDAAQKALSKISEITDAVKDGKIAPAAEKLVPKGDILVAGKDGALYLLNSDVPLTGANLDNARVDTGGDYGVPEVAFSFKPDAAEKFSNLTAANVGKDLAIVLDGVVQTAPVIKGRIPGGHGVIEGNFTIDEARDLAIVLRSGALPAPVNIIEEQTIGPTVGEDSIHKGLLAAAIGGVFILIFMPLYYNGAGLIADLGLVLNILYLLACMSYFGATLSLPGIAGIVLSVAMAVDYNVLVFERMREELALGKPIRIAMDMGFDRAWTAIIDSNITTLISSLFLFQFGSGPIKGFAVTLALGLVISIFTAFWLTRLIFQTYLMNREVTTLSV